MRKTLYDLGYLCILNNDTTIIYKKHLYFGEQILELDIQTQEVKKYDNDFMKKVEIEPETIEVILMKNLLFDKENL